jgi:hypothetical protein
LVKRTKTRKIPIPSDKIYQLAVKYTLRQHFSFQGPPKIPQSEFLNGNFWFANVPFGHPAGANPTTFEFTTTTPALQ